MANGPARYHRQSIRLRRYDYAQAGAYFVTLVTQRRECLFGHVVGGAMVLNIRGQVVAEEWVRAADVRSNIIVDEFVVMPNHVHGIIVITDRAGTADAASPGVGATRVGATRRVAPTTPGTPMGVVRPTGPAPGSLGAIIGQFKSIAAKHINALPAPPGLPLWQRGYYEHIIRDDASLNRIRQYIADNPTRWAFDHENPLATAPEAEDQWQA